MRLPDNEIRDILNLLEAGKPLPEKYRFSLFGDNRQVELVWNGKSQDVCKVVLPFQTVEQVDEPRRDRRTEHTGTQADMFGVDFRGRQDLGWTNKLIWGDNRLVLSSLKAGPLRKAIEDAGGLKLIYIDPPFDVGADFTLDIEVGGEHFTKAPGVLEEIAYRDTWGRGADSFLSMIYERLVLMRDLLADDGSIYVHCDWRVSGAMRLTLDEVFGPDKFINEIIWNGAAGDTSSKNRKFIKAHDTIFFYRKGVQHTWNDVFRPLTEGGLAAYKYQDAKGRYRYGDVSNPGGGGYVYDLGYGEKQPSRGYAMPETTARRWLEEGLLVVKAGKVPQFKRYMNEAGVRCKDVWTDIASARGSQVVGYPTQKPEALLERILSASSNPGDLVADFFCGSGTTLAVAEKLGRRWLGADLGKFAIHTTRKRLIGVQRQLRDENKPYRAFEVLNLGRYERQHFVGLVGPQAAPEAQAQKAADYVRLILEAYRAEALPANPVFQGRRAGRMVVVGPINLPVSRLFVEGLLPECRRQSVSLVDVLGFEFEMGAFPALRDEAKALGIDLAFKHIPREVFDQQAVKRNQVVFYDLAALDFEVRPQGPGSTFVRVCLTDFASYFTQDPVDQVAENLKAGKSQITIDNGIIYKIAKDASGNATRERLTKNWHDWIDYWAVDFNFERRKEIIRVPRTPQVQMRLDGSLPDTQLGLLDYDEVETGDYIFENEWQSFRTRRDRSLELESAPPYKYPGPGIYKVAVKVVDILGNDTMKVKEVRI